MHVTRFASLAIWLTLAAATGLAQDRTLVRQSVPAAETRLALVVGNNAYAEAPLRNAVNDAEAMSETLRGLGFAVTLRTNTTLADLDRAVQTFAAQVKPGHVAMFFYSGHGIQIAGENYLVPVDFTAVDEIGAKYAALSAEKVRERLEEARARLTLIVLDACRNNPFRAVRSGSGGLASMQAGVGTYIALATAPNRTASDNPAGRNGLFTTYLLDALRAPGLSLAQVFSRVREGVYQASNQAQVPWTVDSVIGDFVFRPATPAAPTVRLRDDQLATATAGALQSDCDGGHAAACNHLAIRYEAGRDVAKNEALAANLYQQGCNGGDASACNNLGGLYLDGRGVARDQARAAALYKQGCDAGVVVGCSNLGWTYLNGYGVNRNPVLAAALFQHACDGGAPLGCFHLGGAYERGTGVTADQARASQLYRRACDAKIEAGCTSAERLSSTASRPTASLAAPAAFTGPLTPSQMASAVSGLIRAAPSRRTRYDPGELDKFLALFVGMVSATRSNSADARRLNQDALAKFTAKDYTAAAALLQQAFDKDPGDPEIAANLADAYLQTGDLGRAEYYGQIGVGLNPRRELSWRLLGFVYAKQSNAGAETASDLAFLCGYYVSTNKDATLNVYRRYAANDADKRVRDVLNQLEGLLTFLKR